MGLLDVLMGGRADTGPDLGGHAVSTMSGAPTAPPSLSDRLSNPMSQIGLQMMMASGGPRTGFAAPIAKGLAASAALQKQNRQMEVLRQQHPDIAGYVDAGLDPAEAFNLMMKRQAEEREQKRFDANLKFQQGRMDLDRTQGEAELGLRRDTLTAANLTDDIKEFNYATKNGFTGTFADWQTKKANGAVGGGYGLQPVYGRDPATGKTVVGQLGKDGTIVRSALPDGFEPLSPYDTNYQRASGTAGGQSQGVNLAALPGAEKDAAYAVTKIDELLNDQNLGSATGFESIFPSWPGGTAAGIDARIDQVKGQTFLQAFSSLKGAGAITETEGQKATDAIARLDKAQSDKDFRDALTDLRGVIDNGLAVVRRKAGQSAPAGGGGNASPSGAAGTTSGGLNWSVEP